MCGSDSIDHLEQHVGAIDLLERGAEGIHELVRQLVDEAHGVGRDDALAVAQLDRPARRVERREELVRGQCGLWRRRAR